MFQYKCLNPISQTGLGLFGEEYKQTEDLNNADAVLVRSAKMHDMELPENVKVIARAGAGVNNIPVDVCAEIRIIIEEHGSRIGGCGTHCRCSARLCEPYHIRSYRPEG